MTTGSKPHPYPFCMRVDITCIYKWIGLQSHNHTVMKKEVLIAGMFVYQLVSKPTSTFFFTHKSFYVELNPTG